MNGPRGQGRAVPVSKGRESLSPCLVGWSLDSPAWLMCPTAIDFLDHSLMKHYDITSFKEPEMQYKEMGVGSEGTRGEFIASFFSFKKSQVHVQLCKV